MHRDELWQLFNPNGEPLMDGGYEAKFDNPPFAPGALVGVCCVFLYRHTKNGLEVLFQKRSHLVDRNPDKWDVSAGGHINYGENVVDASAREAFEEIGAKIQPEKLQFVASDASVERCNRLRFIFCYNWDGEVDDFHFDDQEVSEVKWVPFRGFDAFIDMNAKPSLKDDRLIREIIKNFLERRCAD